MKKIVFLLILFSYVILSCGNINMEGYLEGQFKRIYDSEFFEWDMETPKFLVETRFHGSPITNINYYFKFYAESDYFEKMLTVGGRLFQIVGVGPAATAQLITRVREDAFRRENLFETEIDPLENAPPVDTFVF